MADDAQKVSVMRSKRLATAVGWLALGCLLGAAGASAVEMPRRYSARMEVRSQGQTMNMRVFVDEGKTRTEMEMPKLAQGMPGPQEMISIARPDLNVLYIVIPATKSYEEKPLDSQSSHLAMASSPLAQAQELGTENINGKPCTKYRMTYEGRSGLMWVGKSDGIPVRFEMEGGGGVMDFKDVRVGPQAAALFEVPRGYTKGMGIGLLLPGMTGSTGSGSSSEAQVQGMMQGLIGNAGGQGGGASAAEVEAAVKNMMEQFQQMERR